MNPDMAGFYEVKALPCFACEALEGRRDNQSKPQGRHWKEFVIDTRPASDVPREWIPDLSPTET